MNRKLSVQIAGAVLMLLMIAVSPSWSAPASQPRAGFTASPNDRVNWHNLYWSWIYGQTSLPTDGNGNAVQGNTVLMALPSVPAKACKARPRHYAVLRSIQTAFVFHRAK